MKREFDYDKKTFDFSDYINNPDSGVCCIKDGSGWWHLLQSVSVCFSSCMESSRRDTLDVRV